MTETKVARRYAKALLDLAVEKGILEDIRKDMEMLIAACKSNGDLHLMLRNPLIHAEKKMTILKMIFEKDCGKLTMSFLSLIVRKSREFFLVEIASEFISQYKELKGITTAIVVSAVGLDDKLRKEISDVIKNITKSEVELEEKISPEIIGGFVFRFGDIKYDTSVARSLRSFRSSFNKNLYESKIMKK
jgi:F-type H+-transporting ATPase subunit delta